MATLTHRHKQMPEPMATADLHALEKVAPLLQEARLVGPQGEHHRIPAALYQLMRRLLEHLQRGESFTVLPPEAVVTTQQAARILNVSRAYLNQLIASEAIPHSTLGSHRLLQLADVLQLREQRFQQRSAALDELSSLGQELQGEAA